MSIDTSASSPRTTDPAAMLARGHYVQELSLAGQVAHAVQNIWQTIPDPYRLWSWFSGVRGDLSDIVTLGQAQSVMQTADYLDAHALASGHRLSDSLDPMAYLSSTDMVQSRLGGVARSYGEKVAKGASPYRARLESQVLAQEITTGLVRDAGREGAGAIAAADIGVKGYVRVLNLPSCPLCTILAGRVYRWSTDFKVHDHCDCTMEPVYKGQDIADIQSALPSFKKAFDRGQVLGLSSAEKQAIEMGADPAQVVNARRKTYQIELQGNLLKGTRSGVTKRAWWGGGHGDSIRKSEIPLDGGHFNVPYDFRLTPTQIIKLSKGDAETANRLLREAGYIF